MNAIIIDDEPIARQGIKLLADQVPYLHILGEYSNPIAAQEYIQRHGDLQLIFLDIEMPGMTGVDFLKVMPPKCFVIFTTAYHQYALEAYELDVIDYLLKPIRLDRFVKAVSKVYEQLSLTRHDIMISADDPFIYIKSDRKYVKLALEDILYIKGLKDYVTIHMIDTSKYTTAMNIGTILSQLNDAVFARVSKSHIINVAHIKSIDVEGINLGREKISLGKSYKEDFLKKYINKNLLKR